MTNAANRLLLIHLRHPNRSTRHERLSADVNKPKSIQ